MYPRLRPFMGKKGRLVEKGLVWCLSRDNWASPSFRTKISLLNIVSILNDTARQCPLYSCDLSPENYVPPSTWRPESFGLFNIPWMDLNGYLPYVPCLSYWEIVSLCFYPQGKSLCMLGVWIHFASEMGIKWFDSLSMENSFTSLCVHRSWRQWSHRPALSKLILLYLHLSHTVSNFPDSWCSSFDFSDLLSLCFF